MVSSYGTSRCILTNYILRRFKHTNMKPLCMSHSFHLIFIKYGKEISKIITAFFRCKNIYLETNFAAIFLTANLRFFYHRIFRALIIVGRKMERKRFKPVPRDDIQQKIRKCANHLTRSSYSFYFVQRYAYLIRTRRRKSKRI